ncbi:Tyrosine recombinase XerC [subsurface metagenome]
MNDLTTTVPYTQNSPSVIFSETEHQLRIIESIEDNYSFHVRHFCSWVRTTGHQVNFEAIRDYFMELNAGDYAAATIRVKRQAVLKRVRGLFRDRTIEERVKLEEALKDLSTGATRAPKVNSNAIGADKIISPLEYERLLQGARSERQKMFMMFLWVTGCRVSEMLGVKVQHCEHQGDRVHIRIMGKGKKERYVWLPTILYQRIRECFDGRPWLFATGTGKAYSRSYVSNQIAKLGRHILSRRISAHTFRHSFATRKIKETGKIQAVSEYLGHSSVAITLSLYCHDELSAEDLSSETDMIGMVA